MRLRATDISAREIEDETIILDLRDSRYLRVAGVGARLFALLTEERTVDELVETIVEEYDVDRPVARADAERFVDQLRCVGLLEA